jgi:hypothetical protein
MNLWSPLKIWQSRLHDWTQIGFDGSESESPQGHPGGSGVFHEEQQQGGLAAKPIKYSSFSKYSLQLNTAEYLSTDIVCERKAPAGGRGLRS